MYSSRLSAAVRWLSMLVLALMSWTSFCQAASRPNIVFLFCDDLGYGDLSCFANPPPRHGAPAATKAKKPNQAD